MQLVDGLKMVWGGWHRHKDVSAHSTRAAASSAAPSQNVSIKTIMDVAGWSRESTFRNCYDKPVQVFENFAATPITSLACSKQ